MNRQRKIRLLSIFAVGSGLVVAVALVLYAFQQNINVFYTPSQVDEGQAPQHRSFRVGGMVQAGSVVRDANSLAVQFAITDYQHTMTVYYQGLLPDLFREGQGIVADGRLNADGKFIADQVLAKHDEKYMPPEVRDSLKTSKVAPS